MTSRISLPPEPWMTAHDALFDALGAPGLDVRFVGGCVRNAIIGRPIADLDIATPEPPQTVLKRLQRAGIRAIPTGIDHGTVTAVIGKQSYEVTSLRRDTACDGRHADVEFTADWEEDARRRDFTINAMSLKPDATLYDYHGGFDDARAGRVRFVGDPYDRIQEDYLRILRLFRFFAWYGRDPIDQGTLSAVTALKGGLTRLSGERITQEMAKLLAAADPAPAVALMAKAGVLALVLPGADDKALGPLITAEHAAGESPDWLRRLAVMVAAQPDTLVFSNAEAARLAQLTDNALALSPATPRALWNRALYELGPRIVVDRLLAGWARADGDPIPWKACIAAAKRWSEKTLPVSGADVLALGLAPGPVVGTLLRTIEDKWIEAEFTATRDDLLAELKRLAAKG